ncbi:hypothetical protein K432DRAFT_377650, partial [Lepidopterella palustris CBS 459.81]
MCLKLLLSQKALEGSSAVTLLGYLPDKLNAVYYPLLPAVGVERFLRPSASYSLVVMFLDRGIDGQYHDIDDGTLVVGGVLPLQRWHQRLRIS